MPFQYTSRKEESRGLLPSRIPETGRGTESWWKGGLPPWSVESRHQGSAADGVSVKQRSLSFLGLSSKWLLKGPLEKQSGSLAGIPNSTPYLNVQTQDVSRVITQ